MSKRSLSYRAVDFVFDCYFEYSFDIHCLALARGQRHGFTRQRVVADYISILVKSTAHESDAAKEINMPSSVWQHSTFRSDAGGKPSGRSKRGIDRHNPSLVPWLFRAVGIV